MSYMKSAFVAWEQPEVDRFGPRSVKLFAISFRPVEGGMERAQFLIAASDERECGFYLECWWAGVRGYSHDFDTMYYEEYQFTDFERAVGAPEGTYVVTVVEVATGRLDRRGILFKAYDW